MSRYHVNNETGAFGKCTASKRDCPLSNVAEHYDNYEQAAVYSETILAEKMGLVNSLKKEKKVDFNNLMVNSKFPYPQADRLVNIDKIAYAMKDGAFSPDEISELTGFTTRANSYWR